MRTLAMGKPQSAVLSAFVAFALAFTLIPLPAYAEEVETNPNPSGISVNDETAVTDEASENLDPDKYTVTKLDEDAQAQDRVNMSVAIEKQETKAPASTAKEEAKAEEKSETTSAIFSQDGMFFQTVSDTEAAFVGANVNTNKLAIPSTVKSGKAEYTVTAVACTATAAKDAFAALAYIQKAEAVAAQGVSKAVETIVIPKTVTTVDAATLAAYPNAKSIQVAKGNKAFATVNGMLMNKDKTALVAVPEGLTGTAKLPSSLTEVPEAIFARASKVTAIALEKGECAYTTYEGALYTADKKVLVAAPSGIGTSIKTAKECTTIIEGALYGNANLKTIIAQGELSDVATAPEADVAIKNVKDIAKPGETISPEDGKSGFAFTLTDDYTLAVKWAGTEAAPAVVNVPDFGTIDGVSYTVTALAEGAFDGQKAVEAVNIPNTVNTIGKRALAGTSLKSIVINSNITNIEDEAFAELNGTNIVVVNTKPAVAESATKGSTNLNIYMPYIKSGEYGWKTGLPATGNHICPYGVKFASSVYSMKAGETVDLYKGDGYWFAPGNVVTNYTYKAKYVSVDPRTGKITAKECGSSALDVTLTLKVEETTETGTASRDIVLEPASLGNKADAVIETGSIKRAIAALGDTATVEVDGTKVEVIREEQRLVPAAAIKQYIAANRAGYSASTYSTAVNVKVPTKFVFDTSDKVGFSWAPGDTQLSADAKFTNENNQYPVKLTKIEMTDVAGSDILGSDNMSNTTLFKLKNGSSEVCSFGPTSATEKSDGIFTLDKSSAASGNKLDLSLNMTISSLNNADLTMDGSTGNTAVFGKVKFTFESIVSVGLGTSSYKSTDDFSLVDNRPTNQGGTGKTWGLADVKRHANALAQRNGSAAADDTIVRMYQTFVYDNGKDRGTGDINGKNAPSDGTDSTKSYTCTTKIYNGDTALRIVGLNQDVDSSSTKFGLTFIGITCRFSGVMYPSAVNESSQNGWSESTARKRMNPKSITGCTAEYWDKISEQLRTQLLADLPAYKASGGNACNSSNSNYGKVLKTTDYIFFPSGYEQCGATAYSNGYGGQLASATVSMWTGEGTGAGFNEQYIWYADRVQSFVKTDYNNDQKVKWLKLTAGAGGALYRTRSWCAGGSSYNVIDYTTGHVYGGGDYAQASFEYPVMFCL